MKTVKKALERASRAAARTLAALLVAFPTADHIDVLRARIGEPILLALYGAALVFAVTFFQVMGEEPVKATVRKLRWR